MMMMSINHYSMKTMSLTGVILIVRICSCSGWWSCSWWLRGWNFWVELPWCSFWNSYWHLSTSKCILTDVWLMTQQKNPLPWLPWVVKPPAHLQHPVFDCQPHYPTILTNPFSLIPKWIDPILSHMCFSCGTTGARSEPRMDPTNWTCSKHDQHSLHRTIEA
jgi:hypothetical protein